MNKFFTASALAALGLAAIGCTTPAPVAPTPSTVPAPSAPLWGHLDAVSLPFGCGVKVYVSNPTGETVRTYFATSASTVVGTVDVFHGGGQPLSPGGPIYLLVRSDHAGTFNVELNFDGALYNVPVTTTLGC